MLYCSFTLTAALWWTGRHWGSWVGSWWLLWLVQHRSSHQRQPAGHGVPCPTRQSVLQPAGDTPAALQAGLQAHLPGGQHGGRARQPGVLQTGGGPFHENLSLIQLFNQWDILESQISKIIKQHLECMKSFDKVVTVLSLQQSNELFFIYCQLTDLSLHLIFVYFCKVPYLQSCARRITICRKT